MIKKIIGWIVYWFWEKPVSKPLAKEVLDEYVCVRHRGQWINLRKEQVSAWEAMHTKDKKAMARRFATLQKKRKIKFIEINGRMICVKNKDYGNKENSGKQGDGKAGPRQQHRYYKKRH